MLKTLVFTWLTRRGRLQQDVHRMSWLSCQPKLVAQRISSDVPNGLVPLTQRPPSAVPQRSAVGCLGRESVVATVHARCVGPWDPFGCLLGSVNSSASNRSCLLRWQHRTISAICQINSGVATPPSRRRYRFEDSKCKNNVGWVGR